MEREFLIEVQRGRAAGKGEELGPRRLQAGGKVQGGIDRFDKVDRWDEKTGRAKHTVSNRLVRVPARRCVRTRAWPLCNPLRPTQSHLQIAAGSNLKNRLTMPSPRTVTSLGNSSEPKATLAQKF